ALALPFVVEVQTAAGAPLSGKQVNFSPSATASVSPAFATTDAQGRAQAVMTLGGAPGQYTYTASAAGFTTQVTATAGIGPAATVAKVSGDNQTGMVTTTLGQPLVVKVTDA